MITFFSARNCLFSEDLADETINRVILKIKEEIIEKRLAFVYAVAKFVYLESLRKEKNHLNIDEISVPEKDSPPSEDFSDSCLEKCLNELSNENRELLLDYYSEKKQAKIELHEQIAKQLNLTKTALRMRILRIKLRLKVCLGECAAQ